ncbi:TerB family tellurite resistance protein [Pedobacter panaciterrae]|uniref:TerB family tellurite resistance protein n=1 Tax=Pedobacter panaciterrae TaxID=363849 RepID=UPI002594FA98|nr:TerB family tellurite resistance protein [uncultured Pedobacter sp.]
MKKKLILMILLLSAIHIRVSAQATEIAQLLLNVEKLSQFKQILEDMKKGYNILSGGYKTIKDLSQGNFSLHKTFLDGLMQVSPTVRNYRKVAGIIDYQIRIVQEYKTAFNRFKAGGHFNPKELDYMAGVYDRLFKASLKNLDELAMVVTAAKLRMSDDERLAAIDRIYQNTGDKLRFLRNFNNSTSILSLQREKEQAAINQSKVLNNIGD